MRVNLVLVARDLVLKALELLWKRRRVLFPLITLVFLLGMSFEYFVDIPVLLNNSQLLLICIGVGFLVFILVSVIFHKILFSHDNLLPKPKEAFSYGLRLITIFVFVLPILFLFGLVLGLFAEIGEDGNYYWLFYFELIGLFVGWLFYRFGLAFVAAAIGNRRFGFHDSWQATSSFNGSLLIVVILERLVQTGLGFMSDFVTSVIPIIAPVLSTLGLILIQLFYFSIVTILYQKHLESSMYLEEAGGIQYEN